jgi:hypothetical protein
VRINEGTAPLLDVAGLTPIQLQLHMLVFDESFRTLQAQGSAIDLSPWYSQGLGEISILKMTFVCGSEEVALVDSSAQVRIFSFVTLQFRFVSSLSSKFGLVQQSLVDRRPYSSKRPPVPYIHHQMDPASSFFILTIRGHRSLRIIWRRLARLRELPWMFLSSLLKALS